MDGDALNGTRKLTRKTYPEMPVIYDVNADGSLHYPNSEAREPQGREGQVVRHGVRGTLGERILNLLARSLFLLQNVVSWLEPSASAKGNTLAGTGSSLGFSSPISEVSRL